MRVTRDNGIDSNVDKSVGEGLKDSKPPVDPSKTTTDQQRLRNLDLGDGSPRPPADQGTKPSVLQGGTTSSKATTDPISLMAAQNQARLGGNLFEGIQLRELTAGEPFPPALAKQIAAVAGAPLTKAGLTALYGKCLPNTTVVIGDVTAEDSTVAYEVSWLDHTGREVARASRKLTRHEDDSLELHQYAVWVEPQARGSAISAKAIEQERTMLASLSPHENTCITLRAGWMTDINNPDQKQWVGPYVWAAFGFDFAEPYGKEYDSFYGPRVPDEPKDGERLSDLELLRWKFDVWIDKQAEAGTIPNEPTLVEKLKATARKWNKPWEIAAFRIEGLRIDKQIGGHTVPCDIGKAFLTSGEAVCWDGVLPVNQPETTGMQIRADYCERSIQKATAKETEKRATLAQDLASGVQTRNLAAIEEIGRAGGEEWSSALLAARKRDPSLKKAVATAMKQISGEGVLEGLRQIVDDSSENSQRRVESLGLMCELTGKTDWKIFRGLLAKGDEETKSKALEKLVRRELHRDPRRVLDEMDRCLKRTSEADGMVWWTATQIADVAGDRGHALMKKRISKLGNDTALRAIQMVVRDRETPLRDVVKARYAKLGLEWSTEKKA